MRAFHDLRVVLWLFYGCSILVLWLLYGCYILLIELLYLCHTARLYRSDSRYVSSWPFLSGLCFTAPAARVLQLYPDVVLHLKCMLRDQRQGKAARCDERCPHPLEESGTTPADEELATRLATICRPTTLSFAQLLLNASPDAIIQYSQVKRPGWNRELQRSGPHL